MKVKSKKGFTLVEIMVVVVIIGLLAAIAIPAFTKARENSQNARLANDFRTYSGAIETFSLETGQFPEDSDTGSIPAGMAIYIKTSDWNEGPSIGGDWDVEYNSYGVISAIGAVDFKSSNEQLLKFDQRYDDGNLNTGDFRLLEANRYYYVVAD